ncbi:MAG: FAD binding domain-containing protein, partial [Oscillospiraceae bacterium]|nr:FAD binding domain-containing protein [Oscillospiraceae bacterium]
CPELYGIREEEASVHIGALTTFTELEKSELIGRLFPALQKAAAEVGGPQVRNRGTVGGNICAASPAADAAPPLLALDATVVAVGVNGERKIPIRKLFLAPRKTCLTPDEVVTEIILPKTGSRSGFIKVGKRNALAVSSINMAVSAVITDGKLTDVRVAAGSCAPTPRLCPRTAACLLAGGLNAVPTAQEILMEEISPIDDRWATAEYRRMVAKNMLSALMQEMMEEKA